MPSNTVPATAVTTSDGITFTTTTAQAAGASEAPVTAGTTAATSDAAAAPTTGAFGDYQGREPFLYAGLAIMVITVVIIRPLLRHRPDLRVRLGLPYLLTLALVAYGIEGSIGRAVALVVGSMVIVFGLTMFRMMRWRVPAKPQVHQTALASLQGDPYVAAVAAGLKELGFEPLAGYRQSMPNGFLDILAYRHGTEPVVAQIRLLRLGARRYPHMAFASRLRGQGQLWTWNLPIVAPPVPTDWTTFQHATVSDPKALYDLHQQHMAARPAKYVADSAEDTAKRLQVLGSAELQAQVAKGLLVAAGDHYRLAPKGVARLSGTAILAFLGIPIGPKRVQVKG